METLLNQKTKASNQLYDLLSANRISDNISQNSFHQLYTFPLREIALRPESFIEVVDQIYRTEKEKYRVGRVSRVFDITSYDMIERLDFHIKVHSITGIAHWGTSTTESIPYWDRQTLHASIQKNNNDKYEAEIEAKDIGNINCLRAYLQVLIPKYNEARSAVSNLELKLKTKQQTHRDLSSEFQLRYNAWRCILEDYHRVIKAKFKHIIYLTDKLNQLESRRFLYKEIIDGMKKANLHVEDVSINMGIDGGLSEDTYRPAYVIKGFAQLAYLNQNTFSIPQRICPTWDFNICSKSILRNTGEPSLLVEPPEYNLPWNFNN